MIWIKLRTTGLVKKKKLEEIFIRAYILIYFSKNPPHELKQDDCEFLLTGTKNPFSGLYHVSP